MKTISGLTPLLLAAALAIQSSAQTPGISRWGQHEKLAIRKVEILTPSPVCWERLDVRIDLTGTFKSPFDPDEIAVDAVFHLPSGKLMTVPAFFYQDFERQLSDNSGRGSRLEEKLTPADPPEWRVRFMPPEPGKYSLRIRARDRSGELTSEAVGFTAGPGPGHGYIRISKKNPRYFEFDDGTPYFAIGQNVALGPLIEYYRWLSSMAKFGANLGRVWIGAQNFALERGTLGEYRLDNAWRLDQLMELSEYLGIYQLMCIDWVWFIVPRGEPHPMGWKKMGFKMDDYAYSVSSGGPCKNIQEFFTMPEARQWFKKRLRYIVARWGYSPSVLAWELWNEIDFAGGKKIKANDPQLLPEWTGEMCRYLKFVDPWQHLTTNSVAFSWPEIWEVKENDIAQKHGYYWDTKEQKELGKDMANFAMRWLDDVAVYGKPYLFSEYGIKVTRGRDQEPTGMYIHDGLWAPLAYGAAGTAMNWGWNNYIDPKNLYHHFRGVANFVKDIPFTTAGFQRARVETTPENLGAVGQHGNGLTILWIRNKAHTTYNVVNKLPMPPVERGEVRVQGFKSGPYRVEFWDTYEGRVTGSMKIQVTNGTLKIAVPRLEKDFAVKVFPG